MIHSTSGPRCRSDEKLTNPKRGLRPIPKRQQRTTQHQHLRKCQQSQSTAEVMPVDGQEAVRPALPHHIHLVLQHLTEANVKYNSTPFLSESSHRLAARLHPISALTNAPFSKDASEAYAVERYSTATFVQTQGDKTDNRTSSLAITLERGTTASWLPSGLCTPCYSNISGRRQKTNFRQHGRPTFLKSQARQQHAGTGLTEQGALPVVHQPLSFCRSSFRLMSLVDCLEDLLLSSGYGC
jgi:hypothetical protein